MGKVRIMPGFSRISPSIRAPDLSDRIALIQSTVGEPGIAIPAKDASVPKGGVTPLLL
ncbi:MAG: hypothetical protein NTY71_01060 [Methanoregula sp.]|nr:hypothetical protein [Methanoregula sp.]